ncbi:MAG: MtrB/PioB family outer membrane beta-barrel protein [Acidobacteriota bacterium]|jgi:predicted porin
MKRTAHSTAIVLVSAFLAFALALGLVATPAAQAQEDGTNEGRFVIGFRDVNIDGELNKYREDINQDDGPRLMDLDFSYTPDGTIGEMVDRIQLDVDELGGEPFESIRLDVEKYGRYDFSYNRYESDYFYHDQLFPESEVSVRNARAGDFHTFDFRRVRDRASLDVNLNPRAELTFGFDRYRKTGESTTTLDISRDEFELDRPIDEESFEYNVGFQYSWDKVTIALDERYSEYDNAYEIFLPGQSLGESPDDNTIVDFFFLDQPYDFESWTHTARVVATPTDRFTVRASGVIQTLDLDLEAREESAGTGFSGAPFNTDLTGDGEIERDADLWDVDLTYVLTDQWALVGGYYVRNLDQEGDFVFGGVLRRGRWDIKTDGFEGGVQWAPTADLDLTVGVRYESRDVDHGAVEGGPLEIEETSTDHDGYFGNIAWRPVKGLSLTLDYEDSSIDDPFTLASATDRSRLRATGRYTLDNGLWLSASYQNSQYENDNSNWDAEHDYGTFRLGYRNERVNAHVGYSEIEIDRMYAREVAGSFGPPDFFDVDYLLDSSFVDGLVRFRATDDLWLGGEVRVYDNDGSFGISRDDVRVFGEYHFLANYLVRLGYRNIDYNETDFDFDDYSADIVDVGVGLTW